MSYETVIGLEVHVELAAKTKLFCGCENRFDAESNTLVCPVCLGMPGVMPVLNKSAVEMHILAALALGCSIPPHSKFDRKHYFYPDMPKNYQISQYDLPLAVNGKLEIDTPQGKKTIGITRIHLEEDTGKSIHAGETGSITQSDYTLLNFNRAGVPLMEIVSEPEIRSPEEAFNYLTQLKKILVWLGVSDCKMEEGSLRCDANISLRKIGEKKLGVKTEIKNMNSFKAVRAALSFEENRQAELLNQGNPVVQETRGWEENSGVTVSMRSKEYAHDYRYFPEPDLPPLEISEELIKDLKDLLPELPHDMALRFMEEYQLSNYDAQIMTSSRSFADFFEKTVKICSDSKQTANWMMGDVSKHLNSKGADINETLLTPKLLGEMIILIQKGVISGKIGKELLNELFEKGEDPEAIVKAKGWGQISSSSDLLPIINKVLDENPKVLRQYIEGKESVKGFFTGQVMKAAKGRANPEMLNNLLQNELENRKNT